MARKKSQSPKDKTQIGVVVTADLRDRLDARAKSEQRTRSQMAALLLASALPEPAATGAA